MENITVNKTELLEILNKNRADHRKIFEEALAGWLKETQAELAQWTERLKKGERKSVTIIKGVPTDHTKDYDRAIGMVKMAIGDTIVLSEQDYAQYVDDEWGWQKTFLSNSYGSDLGAAKLGNMR